MTENKKPDFEYENIIILTTNKNPFKDGHEPTITLQRT